MKWLIRLGIMENKAIRNGMKRYHLNIAEGMRQTDTQDEVIFRIGALILAVTYLSAKTERKSSWTYRI